MTTGEIAKRRILMYAALFGMTEASLADATSLSKKTIHKIYSDKEVKFNQDTMEIFARVFKVEVYNLYLPFPEEIADQEDVPDTIIETIREEWPTMNQTEREIFTYLIFKLAERTELQ